MSDSDMAPRSERMGLVKTGDLLGTLRDLVHGRRTGTLSINTRLGAAEVRLASGIIEDAVFLRAEGEKALYRVLGQLDATCTFVAGGATGMRRIRTPTEQILAAAPRVVEATSEARKAFPDAHERPLLATDLEPGERSALSTQGRALLIHLRAPVLLDDLLDLVPAGDHEILTAAMELKEAGRVRTLASPRDRVPLASSDQLERMLLAVARSATLRHGPRVRLVFAGSVHRLAVIAHSTLCLSGAHPPPSGVPSLPMPHPVSRIALGEGDDAPELEIAVCPLVPAYSPLWPMTLAGSFAVVRVDEAAGSLFDQACEGAGLRVLDADMLVGPYDETNVAEVAMLIRAAFEG
jgi:hypothetical protein